MIFLCYTIRMVYTDSHIHITQIPHWEPVINKGKPSPVCACAHSPTEWKELSEYKIKKPKSVIVSFGIHPQNPDTSYIEKLERMVKNNECDCIGEAGFDFFTDEYKKTIDSQTEVWNAQLELCKSYNLPLIVHCRHALDKIFADAKKLSKINAVIFHSFPGSPLEAESLLKRNINAFFSIGKPILNGNKRAIKCASELPLERLLAETDAPYQTLKGEEVTPASDIIKVYKKIAELQNTQVLKVCNSIEDNFNRAFMPPSLK